jgi:hypothetical protein
MVVIHQAPVHMQKETLPKPMQQVHMLKVHTQKPKDMHLMLKDILQ